MTRLRLVIGPLVLLLLPGVAQAETVVTAGPATIRLDINPLTDCLAGLNPELCLVAWDDADNSDIGDDTISAYRGVDRLSVTFQNPLGGPTGDIHFDSRDQAFRHGYFVLLNHTWVGLNNSLPPGVREYFTLESRPIKPDPDHWYLFPAIHLPVVVQLPLGGPAAEHVVPFYVKWDTWYTDYEHVYPFGRSGLNSQFGDEKDGGQFDSDRLVEQLRPLAQECPSRFYAPASCGPWAQAVSPAVSNAIALEASVTPKVLLGFALNRTDIRLQPEPQAAATPETGSSQNLVPSPTSEAHLAGEPSEDAVARKPFELDALLKPWSALSVVADGASPAGGLSSAALESSEDVSAALALLAIGGGVLGLAVALFHRLRKEALLSQENRRRVYQFIEANPGTRSGTIASLLGLDYKTVRWHVRALDEYGLVVHGAADAQSRLFIADAAVGRREREMIIASSTPVARIVLDHVRRCGRVEMSLMRRELGLPASSASVAVSRLTRAGLLCKQRIGRQVLLTVAPSRELEAVAPVAL